MRPVCLTIASSDSSCGAGITRDLAVFRDLGAYGVCCCCTVTGQNSFGVHKIYTVAPSVISGQLDTIAKDSRPSAVKIGMFYSSQAGRVIERKIRKYGFENIVLDTPRISKNSMPIITERAFKFLKLRLLPLADVITPNAEEVYSLTGIEIHTPDQSRDACKALADMGARYVIVKGGHLDKPVDTLYDGADFYQAPGEACGRSVHGTGCTFSAALCAGLALGKGITEAFYEAKEYVNIQIERSERFGKNNVYYFI